MEGSGYVIFLSTNLRTRPRKSAVVTQNAPPPPQSRTQIGFVWVSQHAQKIITLSILSLQVLSPFFHPSSTQDSDAYGGSYSNRDVYQFASRFVFLRQRTWPAITYIYIYVYISFWYFLNAYIRSTTVWTPHVNFSDKEVNAPGEIFPAP